MKRPHRSLAIAIAVTCLLCSVGSVRADEPKLTLRLQRLMGYGGFAGDIEGTFRLSASGPADLTRVVIFMDDEQMADLTASPFQVQFNTGQYAAGLHTMRTLGYTAAGLEVASNEIRARFLTADESRRATGGLIIPLLGVVLGFTLLSFLISAVVSRRVKASGQPVRSYGASGGAVCLKCGRAFPLHWWSPNLLTVKLERCPNCGRWAFVRAASRGELAAAVAVEDAVLASGPTIPTDDEEEKLRKELEASRFQDE